MAHESEMRVKMPHVQVTTIHNVMRWLVVASMLVALLAATACGGARSGSNSTNLGDKRSDLFGTGALANADSNSRNGASMTGAGDVDSPITTPVYDVQNTLAVSLVAPLGRLSYDGLLLPLVRPGGKYLAVQEGATTPWETILARPDATPAFYTKIVIYRIEFDADVRRHSLAHHLDLEEIGFLGRSCDDEGFLVEAPQPDGSRWIGKVDWKTGAIDWLIKGGHDATVNAFAAISSDGRLAWCRRTQDEDRFQLFVQHNDGTMSRLHSDNGEWLMPVWANDGRSLFAWHLADSGALELTVMDARNDTVIQRPMARRRIVNNGTRWVVYQAMSPVQMHAAPDPTPRMMFFHPGYDRVCIFDPRDTGVTRLQRFSMSGAWHDGQSLVLGTHESMWWQTFADPYNPSEIAKRAYVPCRTTDPNHPYILLAPVRNRLNELETWAMELVTDPVRARSLSIGLDEVVE